MENSLQDRHRASREASLGATLLFTGVAVFALWGRTSPTGLIAWGVICATLAPLPLILKYRNPSFNSWYRSSIVLEAAIGAAFGSVTLLALPPNHTHQALLAAVLVGVVVAGSMTSANYLKLELAFRLSLAVVAALGFLVASDGLRICAGIIGVAFIYGVEMANEQRGNQRAAVEETFALSQRIDELISERTSALIIDPPSSASTRATRALDNGEISAWFQPIVDFTTGEIVGAEALARWEGTTVQHAENFIEALAEAGRLDDLNALTIASVNQLQRSLDRAGIVLERITVNMSITQIDAMLASPPTGFDPRSLEIEVDEASIMHDVDHAVTVIRQAKALGATVLVDDFGVSYSPLGRTAALPIDGLKIDRSFVSELCATVHGSAVVASLIELADKLNLRVIAEGVESAAQAKQLASFGVQYGQGYYFAPAVSADEFVTRVQVHQASQFATSASS